MYIGRIASETYLHLTPNKTHNALQDNCFCLNVHRSFESSSPLTQMTKLTILSRYNLKMSFFSLILTSNCYFAHNKTLLKYISQMLELLYMTSLHEI